MIDWHKFEQKKNIAAIVICTSENAKTFRGYMKKLLDLRIRKF